MPLFQAEIDWSQCGECGRGVAISSVAKVIKNLLIVSALAETPVGVALIVAPGMIANVLLGASLDTAASLTVARVAGSALLAIGVACWLMRNDGRGVVTAMLIYNVASVAVLGHAGAIAGLTGVLLWPAVALHVALALWCITCVAARV